MHANRVDLSSFDDLEATVTIIFVVARPRQRRADSRMDVRVISQQTFLRSMVEVCPVIDARLMRRRSAEDLWLPCVPVHSMSILPRTKVLAPDIQVTVEVNHGNRAIFAIDTSQKRQSDLHRISPQPLCEDSARTV